MIDRDKIIQAVITGLACSIPFIIILVLMMHPWKAVVVPPGEHLDVDSLVTRIRFENDRMISEHKGGTTTIIEKAPEGKFIYVPGKPETTRVFNETTRETVLVIRENPTVFAQNRGWCLIPEAIGVINTKAAWDIGVRMKLRYDYKLNWGVVGTSRFAGLGPGYHLTPTIEAHGGAGWTYKNKICLYGGLAVPLK
jgi:hypothetical protein